MIVTMMMMMMMIIIIIIIVVVVVIVASPAPRPTARQPCILAVHAAPRSGPAGVGSQMRPGSPPRGDRDQGRRAAAAGGGGSGGEQEEEGYVVAGVMLGK